MVFLLLVAGTLFLVDRLFTWAESRGWMYWRKEKRGSGLGNVMGALDAIYNPARKHQQAEVRRQQDEREDEADGAPPSFEPVPRKPARPAR